MGMGGEIFKNLQLGAWAPTIQCQSICRGAKQGIS